MKYIVNVVGRKIKCALSSVRAQLWWNTEKKAWSKTRAELPLRFKAALELESVD